MGSRRAASLQIPNPQSLIPMPIALTLTLSQRERGHSLSHRQVQPAGDGMVADGARQTRRRNRAAFRRGRPMETQPSRRGDAARARQVLHVSAKRGSRPSTAIGSRRTTPIAATSRAKAAAGPTTTIRRSTGTNSTTTSISAKSAAYATSTSSSRQRGFCTEFYEKNKKLLDEYYTLDLMKAEAAKAKELGCEVLYLDPGWDTGPNQHIWDAAPARVRWSRSSR